MPLPPPATPISHSPATDTVDASCHIEFLSLDAQMEVGVGGGMWRIDIDEFRGGHVLRVAFVVFFEADLGVGHLWDLAVGYC